MAKTRRTFSLKFKIKAVKLVTEAGHSFVEAAHDVDTGESIPRRWRQAIGTAGAHAFPGWSSPTAHEEELRRLHAEVKRPTMDREVFERFEKSDGLLRQGVVREHGIVQANRGGWPVRLMCRVLAILPGGYSEWRVRPRSFGTRRQEPLVAAIPMAHGETKARQGSPRIHAQLMAKEMPCCVNAVAWLIREHGIFAKTKRKFCCTTDSNHSRPLAENVVNRNFGCG